MYRAIGLFLLASGLWGQLSDPKVRVEARGDRAVAVVELENARKEEAPVKFEFAWLDENDSVVGKAGQMHTLKPGKNRIEEELPLKEPSSWLRLQFEMSPLTGLGYHVVRRIFAFAEISDIPFELRASALKPEPGAKSFVVHAVALDPKGQKAREGVQWEVQAETDEEELKLVGQRELAGGFREFEFAWKGDEEAEVTIRAAKGPFRGELELKVEPRRREVGLLQIDKRMYQPGQTIHMRAVAINSEGKAAAGETVVLEVEGPDHKTVFREEVKANAFGVVQRDWKIPEMAKTGTYAVNVDWEGRRMAAESIRVSHYELPTFLLEAKAKNPVLAPGEGAELLVSAKFFSQQPVPGGIVRIFEEEREDPVVEGKADDSGNFVARLQAEELTAGRPYEDFTYRVSYVDPGTLRKEETRVRVRLSREKLHVYFHARSRHERGAMGAAAYGYVVVAYADGRAAEAELEIQGAKTTSRLRTNRYGVARVDLTEFGAGWVGAKLTARTADGSVGTKVVDFSARQGLLQLKPARRLYRTGDALEVELKASAKWLENATALVEMVGAQGLMRRTSAQMREGKAQLRLPYGKDMSGVVSVTAWTAESEEKAFVSVLYPEAPQLQVLMRPAKNSYRPGEEATLQLTVRDTAGRATSAALGVAIVDEALEQAAGCVGCGGARETEIAGLSLRDLSERTIAGGWDADLDLVAEAMLSQSAFASGLSEIQDGEIPKRWETIEKSAKYLQSALESRRATGLRIPTSEQELMERIGDHGGFGFDPWGHGYRPEFGLSGPYRTITLRSGGPDGRFETRDDLYSNPLEFRYFEPYAQEYTNRYERVTEQRYGNVAEDRLEVLPTKQSLVRHLIVSPGEDGKINTRDDVVVWQRLVFLGGEGEAPAGAPVSSNGGVRGGASLSGVVVDASGARVALARMTLTSPDGSSIFFLCDDNGRFLIRGLVAGRYQLKAERAGFKSYRLSDIPLIKGRTLELELELQVGSVSESITVEAATPLLQASMASMSSQVTSQVETQSGVEMTTPRLREYFPETLLWKPDIATDRSGKATLAFQMADSITTWKARVLASTKDGRWARASVDLRAFQPFSLDLETPQVLTEGDTVDLPYAVRDYTNSSAQPELRFEKNEWGEVGAANGKSVKIRALRGMRSAALQGTVVAGSASDAVRKTFTVRPDGRPQLESKNAMFLGKAEFVLSAPNDVLPRGRRTELRVYTHLEGVLSDSIRGLVRIPTGCGEQTTSSAYLNLAAYRFFEASGGASEELRKRVRENLQRGVDGLEQFVSADGGMSYWKEGKADSALSAYALQFLAEASGYVKVPTERLQALAGYVAKMEEKNAAIAALAGRGLIAAKRAGVRVPTQTIVARMARMDASEGAYALAIALEILLAEGDLDGADRLAGYLRSLVSRRGSEAFWIARGWTPFHGWGNTGEIEVTGLVVQALYRWFAKGRGSAEDLALAQAASLYLVERRGPFGVWHSTQATLRAVEGIVAARESMRWSSPSGEITVLVNGRVARRLNAEAQKGSRLEGIVVDLSDAMAGGSEKIEVRSSDEKALMMASIEAEYFVPWTGTDLALARHVKMAYGCDKTTLQRGETARCTVLAQRLNDLGRGMLIAEIGLAPGMRVERRELDALPRSKVFAYEAHPEKLIFYLDPGAGATEFSFGVTPRFGMDAKALPSRIYDYNNPEAATVLAPVKWLVRD